MALKDWKKEIIDSGDFTFRKRSKEIHIWHMIPEGRVWIVDYSWKLKQDEFKSKKDAMKHIISYMRKH